MTEEKMREALQEFVDVCDKAPPVELMIRLSAACEKARAALSTKQDAEVTCGAGAAGFDALERAIARANESMPGISVPACNGDNLAIALCTYFDDGEAPEDDETHWSPAALEGYNQMVAAIRDHYSDAIRALSQEGLVAGADGWRDIGI